MRARICMRASVRVCVCVCVIRLDTVFRMSYCHHLPPVVPVRPSVIRSSKLLTDFSSETPGTIFFKFHMETPVYKICSNFDDPMIDFDLSMARSNLHHHTQVLENCWKNHFSENVLKTNDWNLQCMIKVVNYFSDNKNCPLDNIHVKIV